MDMYCSEFQADTILRVPVLFRTALPCSGDHHLKKGGMSLI